MSKKLAFDLPYYLSVQKQKILERVNQFDQKLYLEFGGKLFDDFHASRVLPGFEPDSKLRLLLSLKDKIEIVIVVNSSDINSNKVRNDLGITYEAEVERLIDAFTKLGLSFNSVVLSMYEQTPLTLEFERKLEKQGRKLYKHYKINGYPQNIPLILSEDGLGKNEYIETTKPIIVVTAPGPGSGKMAVCLSQLYHDTRHGIQAGYSKYETFPIWNLPLKHPVNLAYEAATVDLDDVNMIDPFHLEAYGETTVNYNRDIEVFPLLKAIFDRIYTKSPYQSPTDMGVNMAGFAIKNDEIAQEASKQEIIRRYYQALKYVYLGRFEDKAVTDIEMLLNSINADPVRDRKCVPACLAKRDKTGEPCISIELHNGKIITGKRSALFSSSAAVLLNALKRLAKIDDSIPLISEGVLEPIQNLKVKGLHNNNPRIHSDEVLIALAIQTNTNPLSKLCIDCLPKLKGCQAHSSHLLDEVDLLTFKKLGIEITEEPVSHVKKYAH